MLKKLFSAFFLLSFFVTGCTNGDKIECITSLDCVNGLVCVEGRCVENGSQPDKSADADNSEVVLPDNSNGDPDKDIKTDEDIKTDTDVKDDKDVKTDTDVIEDKDVTEDTDLVDDKDVIEDIDIMDMDTDSVDADEDTNDNDPPLPICGNAIKEGTEDCDLGVVLNDGSYDGCNNDCTLAIRCGDGTKNGMEFCDSGVNNGLYDFCNSDCTGPGERCGDGLDNGEEICDDGANNGNYGYCNSFCTGLGLRCGDGFPSPVGVPPEECDNGEDNGNTVCEYDLESCKVCDTDCKEHDGTIEYCGDGYKNGPEDCDDGGNNGVYDYCASDCLGAGLHCGDGITTEPEACDDGNAIETDYCASCESNGFCGDGIIQSNEDCDEGKFCENDNSIDCTDNEALCGAHACITILKNGCNTSCSTDFDPPAVESVDPVNGAINFMDTIIVVTFSEAMDYHDARITLLRDGETLPVEYAPREHVNLSSFTYKVTLDFSVDYDYIATVLSTAIDVGGNALGTDFVWTFRVDENECSTANGGCDHICTNSAGGYDCSCDAGYALDGDNMSCSDIDECAEGTDECTQNCANDEPGYTCSCDSGYRLESDQITCTNINECLENIDDCDQSHGSCTDTAPGFTCACNAYYTGNGVTCSLCYSDGECGATCVACSGSTPKCKQLTLTTTGCVECLVDTDCLGEYNCSIINTCEDIDECTIETDNCNDNATCTNIPGTFSCACNDYYRGSGIGSDPGCTYCDTPANCGVNCTACPGGQVCKTNTNGTTQCLECVVTEDCDTGFKCTDNSCVDIDECATGADNCDDYATCTNTEGSFSCACNSYYIGDGETCAFCDENGQCEATCLACGGSTTVCKDNGNSTTSCVECTDTLDCSGGYECKVDNSCGDINECDSGNGDCDQVCNNITGDFYCSCNLNYTLDGDGHTCNADTQTFSCAAKPANSDWNSVAAYSQTWNGSTWTPADSTTNYNTTESATSCRFVCSGSYHWDGSNCVLNNRTYTCAAKPANSAWNTVSSYPQTWSVSAWSPADTSTIYNTTGSSTSCRFQCLAHYTWNEAACVADTQTFTCAAKPEGTVWNSVGSYLQTWNGSAWSPADSSTTYNTTGSSTSCRYTCPANYTWNASTCVADTQTYTCAAKPATGTGWNTVDHYTQTWSGSAWSPANSTTSYNTTGSATSCRYQCLAHYTWNEATCVADTQTYTCAAKPIGTIWNTVAAYPQTWNGSAWSPVDSSTTYNTTGSSTSCRYTCPTNYTWNGLSCIADTQTYTCAAKPVTGTEWNTVSSYTQTWSGSAWSPVNSTTSYNTTGSSTSCRYQCTSSYHRDGSTCVLNSRTYTCAAKPGSHTIYNTVSSYPQTWSVSAWTPVDDATTDYNTTSSTTSCRYTCEAGYYHSGSTCYECLNDTHCSGTDICNTTTHTCEIGTYCGDGTKDAGEECDDGDTDDNDGCKNNCTIGTCTHRAYAWFRSTDDYSWGADPLYVYVDDATTSSSIWSDYATEYFSINETFTVTHGHTIEFSFSGDYGDDDYDFRLYNRHDSEIYEDTNFSIPDDFSITANCD